MYVGARDANNSAITGYVPTTGLVVNGGTGLATSIAITAANANSAGNLIVSSGSLTNLGSFTVGSSPTAGGRPSHIVVTGGSLVSVGSTNGLILGAVSNGTNAASIAGTVGEVSVAEFKGGFSSFQEIQLIGPGA